MLFTALALLTASARLSNELDFLLAINAPTKSLRAGCIASGQCYNGNNPAECCVGHVIQDANAVAHCTEALTCGVCQKAANFVVKKLTQEGCAFIIPDGVATCEIIGLGPEDPLADVCALVVGASCPIIANLVSRNIKDPGQICEHLNLCSGGGGFSFGTRCGCVSAGHCVDDASHCCSNRVDGGWFNHCAPIGLKYCD